jgi:hypothetical protein
MARAFARISRYEDYIFKNSFHHQFLNCLLYVFEAYRELRFLFIFEILDKSEEVKAKEYYGVNQRNRLI